MSRLALLALPAFALAAASCGSNTNIASPFEGGVPVDAGHDVTVIKPPPDSGPLMATDSHTGGMDACAFTTATATQTPLDIYFLLDRSGSMAYNHSWTDEVTALEDFFYDVNSDGIGVGLGYMPITDGVNVLCDYTQYTPAVSITPLPTSQGTLSTSLAAKTPFGGTPTTVGLQGAVAAAMANEVKNPTHTTVIVFSSDGIDINGCNIVPDGGLPNTTANAIAVIAAAAALPHPIKTFVIGINPEPKLNDFAMAGGTGKAILIGATDGGVSDGGVSDAAVVDIEGPLIAAFNAVRSQALPCEYSIPTNPSGTINFSDVNVTYTPSGGATVPFYGVNSASDCQSNYSDWYYDNPNAPTRIELCPNSCTTVKSATSAKVNVAYGCQTIAPPK